MDCYNVSSAKELRRSMLSMDSTGNGSLTIKDATTYSRVGFRGKGAEAFLISQGMPIPNNVNQTCLDQSGVMVLRLSQTEFWIIGINNDHDSLIHSLEVSANNVHNLYRLYCQHSHALLLLQGDNIPLMLAKLCGVDLSNNAFGTGSIAQTSVARVNAIVAYEKIQADNLYLVLCDIAYSQFMWDALEDASSEFK